MKVKCELVAELAEVKGQVQIIQGRVAAVYGGVVVGAEKHQVF